MCRLVLCARAETDSLLTAVHDLQDPSRTGPWTISHPVYTPEVGLMNILYSSDRDREGWLCSRSPEFTSQELRSVKVVRRATVTLSDKLAAGLVKLSR
jgi:hypothetical protein